MKEVLVIGSGKTLLNISNKLLTRVCDIGVKIELEEPKKLSDYGDELKLLTRGRGFNK